MSQDRDLRILRIRPRTDPQQPEHPAHQYESDAADHARGSCHPSIRTGEPRNPLLAPFTAAFAAHYEFAIDVLAARRPQGKGRVERQVLIVREHVLAGRQFTSLDELDRAFTGWVPTRRAQTHRTHGQVIAVRAEADHAALQPLPPTPYRVTDRFLRRVGKDCLISFAPPATPSRPPR
jgi:hypothetical protein